MTASGASLIGTAQACDPGGDMMDKARIIGIVVAIALVAAMAITILVLREEVRRARADADAAAQRAQDADERTRAAMDAAARAVAAADEIVRAQRGSYERAIASEIELEGVDRDWMSCPLPIGVQNAVRAVHDDGDSAGGSCAVRDTDGGSDEH